MDDLELYGNSEKEAESLPNTVRFFSKDIAQEFGVSKCAYVTMKTGKLVIAGAVKYNFRLEE